MNKFCYLKKIVLFMVQYCMAEEFADFVCTLKCKTNLIFCVDDVIIRNVDVKFVLRLLLCQVV